MLWIMDVWIPGRFLESVHLILNILNPRHFESWTFGILTFWILDILNPDFFNSGPLESGHFESGLFESWKFGISTFGILDILNLNLDVLNLDFLNSGHFLNLDISNLDVLRIYQIPQIKKYAKTTRLRFSLASRQRWTVPSGMCCSE